MLDMSFHKTARREILNVCDPDKVVVRMDRGKFVSMLEVDIEVPNGVQRSKMVAAT